MMITRQLVDALREARRHIEPATWAVLAASLLKLDDFPKPQVIGFVRTHVRNPEAAWFISEALDSVAHSRWSLIGSAMLCVDHFVTAETNYTEFIWSGPSNGRFPVRRIDQVLYDLIAKAQHRIFLVTFAAYKVDHLCSHLAEAIRRNVQVTLLLESSATSEGQLSADAMQAFSSLPLPKIKILHWPLEKRQRNAAGRPGKLHAKTAIIDDKAIIGSANYTDDAFNRNMELGVLLSDPVQVDQLYNHFAEMEQRRALLPLSM